MIRTDADRPEWDDYEPAWVSEAAEARSWGAEDATDDEPVCLAFTLRVSKCWCEDCKDEGGDDGDA